MNANQKATPAWLKILQLPPVKLGILGYLLFYCIGYSNAFAEQNAALPLPRTIVVVAMISLAYMIYLGYGKFIERREVTELAVPGFWKEMGIGMLIGTGLYSLSVLILMILGIYTIAGFNPVSIMLPAIAMALSSGFLEELLFRGVLFRIVEEWLGSWISMFISSLVFGLVHLMNPAGTLMGALFIAVEAGILLAATYMLTKRLWMGIGFHVSWNYFQSAVYGGIVSGGVAEPGLIRPIIDGPVALTGGSFGLEMSLIACTLCTATGIYVAMKAAKKGNVVPPIWAREKIAPR